MSEPRTWAERHPQDMAHYDDEQRHKPCPACPDGYVWDSNGPTGKCCPVCKGHAALNLDGSTITTRGSE